MPQYVPFWVFEVQMWIGGIGLVVGIVYTVVRLFREDRNG